MSNIVLDGGGSGAVMPLSKKQRKKARKAMARAGGGGIAGVVQPNVTARLVESAATFGIHKFVVKPKLADIDADKKLSNTEREKAKKDYLIKAFCLAFAGEQFLDGQLQRVCSGARGSAAAALADVY